MKIGPTGSGLHRRKAQLFNLAVRQRLAQRVIKTLTNVDRDVLVVDLDDNRLEVAKSLGATSVISSKDGKAVERVLAITGQKGVDVAIEAVGIPATFDICQDIVAAGGHIANVGVHGKAVSFKLEKLWAANITLTTRLVDTVTTKKLGDRNRVPEETDAVLPQRRARGDRRCRP